jgi:hypothetical protein
MKFCDKPLGLPEGSVRALLSLTIVGASFVGLFKGVFAFENAMMLITIVTGFYFANKK